MKASMSTSTEIDVDLTYEEIFKIFNESIKGKIKVREYNGPNPVRDLEIVVGEMSTTRNEFLELKYVPDCDFENLTGYVITISQLGYESLKEKGSVIDRPSLGVKVNIRRKDVYSQNL